MIMEPGMSAVKILASEKQPKSAAQGPRTELRSLAQVQETHPPFLLLRHISQLLLSKFKSAQEQRRTQASYVMLFFGKQFTTITPLIWF
jgi:hypothetical protein